MPRIDLTVEESDELRDVLYLDIDRLDRRIHNCERAGDSVTATTFRHTQSLLRSILKQLEDI